MDGPKEIMLSEISRRKTNTMWYHLYMKSKKIYKWIYIQNKNGIKDIENKHGYQREEAGRDKLRLWS